MTTQVDVILIGANTYRTLEQAFTKDVPAPVSQEFWESHLKYVRTSSDKRMFRLTTDPVLDPDEELQARVGLVSDEDPVPNVKTIAELLGTDANGADDDDPGVGSGTGDDALDGSDTDPDGDAQGDGNGESDINPENPDADPDSVSATDPRPAQRVVRVGGKGKKGGSGAVEV